MNVFRVFFLSLLTVGMLSGCIDNGNSGSLGEGELELAPPDRPCGSPLLLSIHGDGPSLGVFEVMNDTHNLWISLSHSNQYKLEKVNIFVGSDLNFPTFMDGKPNPEGFNIIEEISSDQGKWIHHIPLDQLPNCPTFSVHIEMVDRASEIEGEKVVGWAIPSRPDHMFRFSYCKQACTRISLCEGVGQGQFNTYALEDWVAEGMQARQQLVRDFETVFPDGIEIGCNYGIELSSANSVQELLLHSGEANQLEKNFIEGEGASVKNIFANQLCVLALNLGFDERIPEFSPSPERLRSLLIKRGPFKAWSVGELFNEANTVLGGCTSSYSAHQLVGVLEEVNQNFASPQEDSGFLACPK